MLYQEKEKKFKTGFTLAELLLVVAILGVLSILMIPKFFPKVEKAKVAEAVAMLNAIRQGEKSYWLENGVYLRISSTSATEPNWAKLGLDNPNVNSARSWSYTVACANCATGSDPQTSEFIGLATRINVNSSGPWKDYANMCFGIDKDGNYRIISASGMIYHSCTQHTLAPPN